MNLMLLSLISISFMMLLFSFFTRQHHLLSALMNLEALMLFIICFIPIISSYTSLKMNFIMIILLILSVSSASISLSLLILMSRKEGSDNSISSIISSC